MNTRALILAAVAISTLAGCSRREVPIPAPPAVVPVEPVRVASVGPAQLSGDAGAGALRIVQLDLGAGSAYALLKHRQNNVWTSLTSADAEAGSNNLAQLGNFGQSLSLGSSVVLVADRGAYAGVVQNGDSIYFVRASGPGETRVTPFSQKDFVPEAAPLVPGAEHIAVPPAAEQTCAPAEVSILVLYTDGAEAALQGFNDLSFLATAATAYTNQALMLSAIEHRIKLAGLARVDYREEGNIEADLDRLAQKDDGFLDIVHDLRSQYQADIVSLWVGSTAQSSSPGVCGLGYVLNQPAQQSDWGFNVVLVHCAAGYYSFAHELGHNFGMNHERGASQPAGAFDFSYAFVDPQDRFRTIMASRCASSLFCEPFGRVLLYSSPDVPFGSARVGIDHRQDSARSADNARTARATMCEIARWR